MSTNIGNLPNLIIIGAPKSGTSALHYYLNLHPEIAMSTEKELDYFIKERNWSKGINWYKSNFKKNAKIRGESSPAYTRYPLYKGVAKRMFETIPDAQLIFLVRDPIQRAISHYKMHYGLGQIHHDFSDIMLSTPSNLYLEVSSYFRQLEQFLPFYQMDNILVISQEAFLEDRMVTLRKIFAFLTVREDFKDIRFNRLINKTTNHRRKNKIGLFLERLPILNWIKRLPPSIRYLILQFYFFPFSKPVKTPEITPAALQKMIRYLTKDVASFRQITKQSFSNWSI